MRNRMSGFVSVSSLTQQNVLWCENQLWVNYGVHGIGQIALLAQSAPPELAVIAAAPLAKFLEIERTFRPSGAVQSVAIREWPNK